MEEITIEQAAKDLMREHYHSIEGVAILNNYISVWVTKLERVSNIPRKYKDHTVITKLVTNFKMIAWKPGNS